MYAGRIAEAGPMDVVLTAAEPSLYHGSAECLSGPGGSGERDAHADRGRAAQPARAPSRLPVRAALPLRSGHLHQGLSRRCVKSSPNIALPAIARTRHRFCASWRQIPRRGWRTHEGGYGERKRTTCLGEECAASLRRRRCAPGLAGALVRREGRRWGLLRNQAWRKRRPARRVGLRQDLHGASSAQARGGDGG